MNRFIINLRSFDSLRYNKYTTGIMSSNISDIQFRTPTGFLGNIGEPLETGLSNEDSYEEEVVATISYSNHEALEVRIHLAFLSQRRLISINLSKAPPMLPGGDAMPAQVELNDVL